MESDPDIPEAVHVPEGMKGFFDSALKSVASYFRHLRQDPTRGTIEILDQRYLLIRSSALSVEFHEMLSSAYPDPDEAANVARSLLFDLAHAVGKSDARCFHERMNLTDPIERLSAGPVHFAWSGWAFVDILPESRPTTDDNFFLVYDHPYSFESDSWLRAGRSSAHPVCTMNAGYSSGWTQESFGLNLVAVEILCKARGDEHCRFVMAAPHRLDELLSEYLSKHPGIADIVGPTEIPAFLSRKQMEEELREREAEYRGIFESGRDGLLVATRSGEIVEVNPALCELVRRPRKQLVGLPIEDLFRPGSAVNIAALVARAESSQGFRSEADLQTRGEHSTVVDLRASTFRYRRELHVLVSLRDVSVSKRIESELRALKTSLEAEVQRRTRELEARKAELRQAQKMELVGQLAGGIAHDFHNILTVINGYSSLLSVVSDDERVLRASREIHGAVQRATLLTRQLLAFSRRQVLNFEPLDLADEIERSRSLLERLISEDVAITVTAEPDLPAVRADRTQLEQVLLNLCVNARDAMPRGGLLTVEVDRVPEGGAMTPGWVRLRVTDTGVGIEPEVAKRIFEPFFTTKPVGRGTGLGLSTVYGIVEQSGGEIAVDSTPGQGTCFTIAFPPDMSLPAEDLHESADIDDSELDGTILLAEDDPAIRAMLPPVLEQRGFKVLTASDGVEAKALADETAETIDLLITDVVMPRMSGVELARALLESRPELRILFVSGYTRSRAEERARWPEQSQLLEKPFDLKELFEAIQLALVDTPAS